jgi:hypothetical protein
MSWQRGIETVLRCSAAMNEDGHKNAVEVVYGHLMRLSVYGLHINNIGLEFE